MGNKQNNADWSSTLLVFKTRIIKCLLATLVFTLLVPVSPANATEAPKRISLLDILGVTPPVAGAIPDETIDETVEYTGTVSWSNFTGSLVGNFETATIYAATITLTLKDPYVLPDTPYRFRVAGASHVSENYEGEIIITAIFNPAIGDANIFLDKSSFGKAGSISMIDIFGEFPLDETGTAVGPVKVDRIAVDSKDRIVVLASFYDALGVDNHILFRLNPDGSYDDTFGNPETTLRKDSGAPKKYEYVLVATTGFLYTEKVDLRIDSDDKDDKILVLLSGYSPGSSLAPYHNLLVRYQSDGKIDPSFGGGDGVIGSLEPQDGPPETVFSDVTLDADKRIIVASLPYSPLSFEGSSKRSKVLVQRLTRDGVLITPFGGSETGTVSVDISYPGDGVPPLHRYHRQLQVIADDAGGYIIAFTGEVVIEAEVFAFTQLLRLKEDGFIDTDFINRDMPGATLDNFILPGFYLTDLVPDGRSGFILSGTFADYVADYFSSGVIRFKINGGADTEFSGPPESGLLNPIASYFCANSALLRYNGSDPLINRVLISNYCFGDLGRLKAFSPSGRFQGEFSLEATPDDFELQIIDQLMATRAGKIIVLRGARPTSGYLGFEAEYGGSGTDWTRATISRYDLTRSTAPSLSAPIASEPVAPTPVPFLKTVTAPKLNLTSGKLICTAGTYQAGYTLGGVAQGSSTALFTPSSYTFNLIINGSPQTALVTTSASNSATWDLAQAPKGSTATCSTVVTANSITNIDSSTANTNGLGAAQSIKAQSIATADAGYQSEQSKNSTAYSKALVSNRALWRTQIAQIRADYLIEKNRISALTSSKETRALASAALKAMTVAQRKSAADYKASQPAALTAKDAANKVALATRDAAIAKANDTYGTFIESIGYGVLIP